MRPEKARRLLRPKTLAVIIGIALIGHSPPLKSIKGLQEANQGVRNALKATDPFIVSRDFYRRIAACQYDWRFQCLCPLKPLDHRQMVDFLARREKELGSQQFKWGSPLDRPQAVQEPLAAGCVPKRPSGLGPLSFLALFKIIGIPDGAIYATRQVMAQGWLALGLAGLSLLLAVLFVFGALLEVSRENVLSWAVAVLLTPAVGGLVAWLLRVTFLAVTGVFGAALSILVWGGTVWKAVMEGHTLLQTADVIEFGGLRVRRWWGRSQTDAAGST